jgi:hypothetical protein
MARKLKLQTSFIKTRAPWDAEQTLAEALAERAQFLENHPQYKPFQIQIDRMLDKAGNAEARMTVLAILMEAKLIELRGQFKHLNRILLKTVN